MKIQNGVVLALFILLFILIYQMIDLKQELRSNSNNNISFPSSLYLNGPTIPSTGFGDEGFWVYKDDEKQVYYFMYDTENNQIVMTKKLINR